MHSPCHSWRNCTTIFASYLRTNTYSSATVCPPATRDHENGCKNRFRAVTPTIPLRKNRQNRLLAPATGPGCDSASPPSPIQWEERRPRLKREFLEVKLTLIDAKDPTFDRTEEIYRLAGAKEKFERR